MKKDFKELIEKIITVVNDADTDYDSREQVEELLEMYYQPIPTVDISHHYNTIEGITKIKVNGQMG